jgi:hypothetical protein
MGEESDDGVALGNVGDNVPTTSARTGQNIL